MMLNKICVYNNKLFLALDTYLVAYTYKKYPKSEDEKFLECFKLKIPVKSLYGNDIRLDVVNNHVTGLKSLMIFVFEIDNRCSIFIYGSEFPKKLYGLISPKETVDCDSNDWFVSDGPTYSFRLNDTVHVYSVPHAKHIAFDPQSISQGSENYTVLQFKCFGPLKSTPRQFLFLVVIGFFASAHPRIKIAGYISEKIKLANEWESIPLHVFFPGSYENILKAVYVLKAAPSFKLHSSNLQDSEWEDTACVICTQDECLIFEDAVLKYCCKLTVPLLNVVRMKVELSNMFLKNATVVVLKYWIDIEAAVTGEITEKGSKQVLLLKPTDLDSWQSGCVLYDMSSFVPINVVSHSAMPDECLKVTLSGLQKKVQLVKSAIRNVEQEISQKSAATVDALNKLNEMRVKKESLKQTNTFQESLVDLILLRDENKVENIPFESKPCVKLLSEKQRVTNNHRIVSFCFINDGERSIFNPNLKVLWKGQQVACIQKLFVNSSADCFFSKEYGKQINSKAKFFVVLSLDCSVVHISEDIFFILSWYNGTPSEFDNDVFAANGNKAVRQNQICIKTRVGQTQVLLRKDSSDDVLFTRVLQQRVTLSITSLHSYVDRVEECLTRNNPECFNLTVGPSAKCVAFNSASPLCGVHLVFMKSEGNVAEIEAFVRNEKDVYLLVSHLYKLLPEDVILSPCLTSRRESPELKKSAALCLKQEMDTILASLSVHNIPDEARKNDTQRTVGTLTVPKATYRRIRTALVKKECITDAKFKSFS